MSFGLLRTLIYRKLQENTLSIRNRERVRARATTRKSSNDYGSCLSNRLEHVFQYLRVLNNEIFLNYKYH